MLRSSPFISGCPWSIHFPADKVENKRCFYTSYLISGCVTIQKQTDHVSSFYPVLVLIFAPLVFLVLFARIERDTATDAAAGAVQTSSVTSS